MNNLFIAENLRIIKKGALRILMKVEQNEVHLIVKKSHLTPALVMLKNRAKYQFKIQTFISRINCPLQKYQFKITYELFSLKCAAELEVEVLTNELTPIKSRCGTMDFLNSMLNNELTKPTLKNRAFVKYYRKENCQSADAKPSVIFKIVII